MIPSILTQTRGEPMVASTDEPIRSVTIPWRQGGLLDILRCFPNERRTYWRSAGNLHALAGVGAAAVLTAQGVDRFGNIRQQAGELFGRIRLDERNPIPPTLIGGIAYRDETASDEIWSSFPSALFILPRFQWTLLNGEMWLTINQAAPDGVLSLADQSIVEEHKNLSALMHVRTDSHLPAPNELHAESLMTAEEWNQMAAEAIRRIRHGVLEKVVLARGVDVHTDQVIDPIHALTLLDKRYPECMRFLIEPAPGTAFLGATPETLAALVGRQLKTIALAGSARRGASPEEDDLLARSLMESPKEQHEHALVVQAIRSLLAPLVDELTLDARPGLWRLGNIQHLRTHVRGDLVEGCDLLDVIEALHPTPALGGTPRREALAVIEELEPISRGWYASPVGWIDANGDGEFAVAIRSAVTAGTEARLYAGAGIVANSDPAREWDETSLKLRPMLEALRGEL